MDPLVRHDRQASPTSAPLDELNALGRTMMEGRRPAGNVASYVFQPDINPYDRPTWFLVAVFEDEATYRANASSPEQDAQYRQLRELRDDDPDWTDGAFEGG